MDGTRCRIHGVASAACKAATLAIAPFRTIGGTGAGVTLGLTESVGTEIAIRRMPLDTFRCGLSRCHVGHRKGLLVKAPEDFPSRFRQVPAMLTVLFKQTTPGELLRRLVRITVAHFRPAHHLQHEI